jgi:succinoglycan biosynthesis protein ExoM
MNIQDAKTTNAKTNGSTSLKDSAQQQNSIPHICVCVCTYKRPLPLMRLLREISRQDTGGLFTYSMVVVDNDKLRSGEAIVEEMRSIATVPVQYYVEPRQSIALARNMAIANANGTYVVFIDDDEFPIKTWLQILIETCLEHQVDGVLGPVKRHFDEVPPAWLQKSNLLDRKVNPTGMRVDWHEARTGNVLLKRVICDKESGPFRSEFRSGSDTDFFRRKTDEGYTFIWSADAIVFEVIPPARWSRTYYIRRALLTGAMEPKMPTFGLRSIFKSVIAVPLYAIVLPFSMLLGQHHFMNLLFSLCHHLGKLLACMGIHVIRSEYITN